MKRTTVTEVAAMVAAGFNDVMVKLNVIDGRVSRLEDGQKRLEEGQERLDIRVSRLERSQEEIIMKLDNKCDKIDFPETYPEYKRR